MMEQTNGLLFYPSLSLNVIIAKITCAEVGRAEITYQEVKIAGCDSHCFSHFGKRFLCSIGDL